MCSIEKMLIKGIRSFGPYNEDAITFFKPLTIIVGPNGSGKTTVIECLKQACTGSLPPTCKSSRAAFIHDPKLSGQKETRAQIKLRFADHVRRSPVVLVKSFLLTVKGSTSTFKATDQTVKTFDPETKEYESHSCKVQDVEKLVPTLMGASQAVLDSVIFVHQDEMNWPLDDPQTVKKKFDSIFNLSGYTKAIDAMKKARLDNVHEVEKHKLRVGHLRTHRERSQTLKKEIASDKAAIDEMNTVIADFEDKASRSREEMASLESQVAQHKALAKDLEMAAHKMSVLQEANKTLYDKMGDEEATEDIDELVEMKDKMEQQLHKYRLELRGQRETLESCVEEESVLRKKFRENETLESRLFAEIDVNRRELKETRERCRELANECLIGDLSQWDASISDNDVMENYAVIERKSREKESKLKAMKADAKRLEQNLSEGIREAQTQVYHAEDDLKSAVIKRKENLRKIVDIETWQSEIQMSETEHKRNEAKEKELSTTLKEVLAEQTKAKSELKAKGLDERIRSLEERCGALRREKDQIQENSTKHALYHEKMEELKRVKEKSKTLLDSKGKELCAALGVAEIPPAENLLDEIQAKLKDLDKVKDENLTKRNRVEAKMETLSQQMEEDKKATESLRLACREKEGLLGDLTAISMDSSIEDICREKEAKVEKLNDRINHMNALDLVFTQYIRRTSDMHACPACTRPFEGNEEATFIQRQKDSKENLPQKLQQANDARDKVQKDISELRSKASLLEEMKRLREDLATAEKKQETSLQERTELEENGRKLRDQEAEIGRSLSTTRGLLEDFAIPLRNHALTIKNLETALGSGEGNEGIRGSRSLDEVKTDLSAAEGELKSHTKAKEEERLTIMNLNEKVGECERELREHREVIAKAEGNAVELKTRLKEKEKLERENSEIDSKHQGLTLALKKAKASLDEIKSDSASKSNKMQKEVDAVEDETYQFLRKAETMKTLCEKLTRSDVETSERQLVRLQRSQGTLKEELKALEAKTLEAKRVIDSEEQNVHERGAAFRNIDDNLTYKRGVRDIGRAEEATKAIRKKIGEMPSGEDMNRVYSAAKHKFEESTKKTQYLRGSRKTLEQKIKEREIELMGKEYRNIDRIFNTENVALRTKTLAITDIDNYLKALKKALITFHNRKMGNINKTIKELWQKTYRNSDIDYIQIKYEEGGTRGGSHNYRVVMVSGGTELAMRGRCSAGQRVLASIIIRLALAETFCVECGILALDEPTTNLDEENSRSLAVMVQQIIKDRSAHQKNFQMIVITHDEKFVGNFSSWCDQYWYVHKDENQLSKCKMQNFM